jgi:NADPH:quinone reductase-like Zn-dependent oxidoreductase
LDFGFAILDWADAMATPTTSGTVRAVVVDPAAPGRLGLRAVAPPVPGPGDALVRVAAVSLNRGEVRRAATAEAGWRPGWDLAGTVEAAAADGSGPAAGARVVGLLRSGAWAELVAVPAGFLAEVPPEVSFAQAATLPVAGLTALHALAKGGSLLGRTVLVTGASGGVGHLAVQLARGAGARVVGLVRQERYVDFVRELGAHEVVAGGDGGAAAAHGPYHLIVEAVGGAVLAQALQLLAPDGTCVSFGASGGQPATLAASPFGGTGGASLYGLQMFHELAREPASVGLARLARLVAEGRLRPHVAIEAPWTEVGAVAQQLLDRRFPGKAVLHLQDGPAVP